MIKHLFFTTLISAALLPCLGFGSQPDYTGTDDDEVLDASDLIPDGGWIDGGRGDDTITLSERRGFISGPGDDTVIGSGSAQIGFKETDPYVNLAEGYVLDGYGGRDTISGVIGVHLWGGGGEVVGASQNERVFAFDREKVIDLGDGTDTVTYYGKSSTEYEINFNTGATTVRHIATGTEDRLENVEWIEFSDRTVNTEHESAPIRASLVGVVHSFTETEIAPEYVYEGEVRESATVANFPQAVFKLDLNEDGLKDLIVPINRAYSTGLDTSTPWVALTTSANTLNFDSTINSQMPINAGSRRSRLIRLTAFDVNAFITVQHDTGDGKGGDLVLMTENLLHDASDLIPTLPGASGERPRRVEAHSLAVGDFDGDGDDDVLVGEWIDENGAYFLWQQENGLFEVEQNELLRQIARDWPLTNTGAGKNRNYLTELSAADLNGDGADDIIVGWGHGSAERQVFLSSSGQFSVERSFRLPTSVYGIDNQVALDTFPYDYDLDGDVDLVLLWSRTDPWYGGDYLQVLRNDGGNNFVDVTTDAMLASSPFTDRGVWNAHWTLIDANKDGYMDIAGQIAGGRPYLMINTGAIEFGFRLSVLPWDTFFDRVLSWGDFTGDGKLNFVAFRKLQAGLDSPSDNEFGLFSVEGIESISAEPASNCEGSEPCSPVVDNAQSPGGSSSVFQLSLEEPVADSIHTGVGNLRGWAVSESGIDKVELWIDDAYAFDVPYGGSRGDVGNAFSDIAGSSESGFSMAFAYSNLSAGGHVATAIAYDADGSVGESSVSFSVVKFEENFIADPNAVDLSNASCSVSGDEVSVVDAVVSGDPLDMLLKWRRAEQGFEIIEIHGSGAGAAMLQQRQAMPITDAVANAEGSGSTLRVTLEEPVNAEIHSGVGNLRGWAVASQGIEKIAIYVDGNYAFDAPYGGARGDVGSVFPDVPGSTESGFSLAFTYSNLTAGAHTIEAVARTAEGVEERSSATFEVVKFAQNFISDLQAVNLDAASCATEGDEISITGAVVAGETYDMVLDWRKAEQGFEIVDIQRLN